MRITKEDIDNIKYADYALRKIAAHASDPEFRDELSACCQRLCKVRHLLMLTYCEPPLSLDIIVHGGISDTSKFAQGAKILVDAIPAAIDNGG